jgi:predicted DNA-binding transcriptional regulator YafY
MTAKALAQQLEVSERTVYRDVDSLSAAGVPIYGEPGREGGFALIDSYRTSLTGLTDGELQALFTLSIPGPLAELGIGQELRAALLKLAASLPDDRRTLAAPGLLIHVDTSGWEQEEQVPYLQMLYQATRENRRVRIVYHPLFQVRLERLVEPFGLVSKAGVWYLVCASQGRIRIQPFSGLLDVQQTGEYFNKPPGFDLTIAWEEWCAGRSRERAVYSVQVRVSPGLQPFLSMYFGPGIRERLALPGPLDPRGWITLELSFESLEAARDRLLDFGSAVEVLTPHALRLSMQDYGEQIAGVYRRTLREGQP